MLNVRNDSWDIQQLFGMSKKLVIYGAGASTKLLLQELDNKGLSRRVAFIVDQNEGLDGSWCSAPNGVQVQVISLPHFCSQYGACIKNEFMLLIMPFAAMWIVSELDKIEQLDGVDTYLYALITSKKRPVNFTLKNTVRPLIPKRIHYIWIGDKPMSDEDIENIESWRKFCPDYEIIKWDERSYDFSKNRYMREALESKQYMYVTDYARKDILFHYGGIYLDTDVELLKPLDELLYNEAFIGIEDCGQLNSGSGLGADVGHSVMRQMMEIYDDKCFINEDGSYNLKYNTYYETSYMLQQGYELKNEYQVVNGIACFPKEVFMPESIIGLYDNYTENTVSNHKINPFDKTYVRSVLKRIYEQEAT